MGATEEMTFAPYRQNGWKGWVLDEWQQLPELADLETWLQAPQQTIVLEAPCRTVSRRETALGAVYVKLMRGRNDGAVRNREVFSWLKWTLLPSRGVYILKVTAAMAARGHHCPTPVLGARCRGRWGYPRELYVSREVTLPTLEECLVRATGKGEQQELLAFTAERLARFHLDHFVHGDFLPRNACVDTQAGHLYFLDNDRTRHWPFLPPFQRQRRNLAQFCYNLMLLDGSGQSPLPADFLKAYAEARPDWSLSRRQAEVARVQAQCDRRWKKYGDGELAWREKRRRQAGAVVSKAGEPPALG
ncbi:MAG: hypothetical protein BWX73_01817 [Lentisphaerae bacterium ADurb.Bin082]|nr:MAG: hypothetical protein BWX73_01817 [Lentisphaerae bacterium ADurb.Bin082]HQL87320.1 hypothetical protein [Lentisphaeria bacterium]